MYNEIRKNESYKDVLRTIARLSNSKDEWIPRQKIIDNSSKEKTSVGAALFDLVKKQLIIKNPDKSGEYKFYSKMFQVYVSKIFTI